MTRSTFSFTNLLLGFNATCFTLNRAEPVEPYPARPTKMYRRSDEFVMGWTMQWIIEVLLSIRIHNFATLQPI